jgi:hypothetical protein
MAPSSAMIAMTVSVIQSRLKKARGLSRPLGKALRVNLDPAAPDFYDYTTADWYATTLRTLEPRMSGPYVDYACTSQYAVTDGRPGHGGRGGARRRRRRRPRRERPSTPIRSWLLVDFSPAAGSPAAAAGSGTAGSSSDRSGSRRSS